MKRSAAMQVREIMTREPACCTPETKLRDVARLMMDQDCGQIPVVDSKNTRKPIGVVTDRDIVVRVVADSKNPSAYAAETCMSQLVSISTSVWRYVALSSRLPR
jgi:CBS domain-containing protein